MSKKHNQKLITPEILRQAVIGSFQKLNPRYMMKNPVMFVVEVGCAITLVLSFFPNVFGDLAQSNLRTYNIIVCVILFITVLFANFAESVAEGRGKAQAASLKKTQKGNQGPAAEGGRHRGGRSFQRVEKRRRGYGFCRRDYPWRRRGYRGYCLCR